MSSAEGSVMSRVDFRTKMFCTMVGGDCACLFGKERAGRKQNTLRNATKLSEKQQRRLLCQACLGQKSASELKTTLELPVSVRRVQQFCKTWRISNTGKCWKFQGLPWSKKRCDNWARCFMLRRQHFWASVLSSDEIKCNLDVPDGLIYYWHDCRKDLKRFSTMQNGSGSLMIWGAISF